MRQEDFEDPNVMNLSETKSQRAPTFEAVPSGPTTKIAWLKAAGIAALLGFITVTLLSLPSLIRSSFKKSH